MSAKHILIVGGGIGGLTASLSLAKVGFDVTLFEQAPEFGEIGAGIQLSPNCTRVLHHLGLEDALRSVAFLPQASQFRAWRSGKVINESPLGEALLSRFGVPYYHIHRGDLLRVLVDAATAEPAITLLTDTRVDTIAQAPNGVTLTAAGTQYTGDVAVGADGIHSTVRKHLWGEQAPRFTGNVAWRALVPTDRLPEGLVRPMSTIWWGPHKHFVHYYVRSGELVNCVCVIEKQGWTVESWNEPGDYSELKADFRGWHESIQMLIDAADRDSLYKWALFDRDPMPRWGRDRITLLGDACHPTLPFMAQGAAMAIEDAAVLTGCLTEVSSSVDDVAARLSRFENLRRERTASIQLGSRRNAKVFHMSGVMAWARNRSTRIMRSRTMKDLFAYNALTAAAETSKDATHKS